MATADVRRVASRGVVALEDDLEEDLEGALEPGLLPTRPLGHTITIITITIITARHATPQRLDRGDSIWVR